MSFRRRAARFNRVFANHIFGLLMPRFPGFAVVCHYGRSSGRPYRTPVKVFRSGENYLISLPYGRESDWVRNVLAAKGCDLEAGGQRVRLAAPQVRIDPAPAELPPVIRFGQKRLRIVEHLVLEPAEAVTQQPSGPGRAQSRR